mmetsp:Transcript_81314/g.220469  ORF Transcript_81314/g.220469 Transcript_81314/m.220469 type:complete len:207 (+) Transcript_81314:409-1029(+)
MGGKSHLGRVCLFLGEDGANILWDGVPRRQVRDKGRQGGRGIAHEGVSVEIQVPFALIRSLSVLGQAVCEVEDAMPRHAEIMAHARLVHVYETERVPVLLGVVEVQHRAEAHILVRHEVPHEFGLVGKRARVKHHDLERASLQLRRRQAARRRRSGAPHAQLPGIGRRGNNQCMGNQGRANQQPRRREAPPLGHRHHAGGNYIAWS